MMFGSFIIHTVKRFSLQPNSLSLCRSFTGFNYGAYATENFCVKSSVPQCVQRQFSTVFVTLPESMIWEGVTGPKGSSKKRARGKRRVTRPKINLNAHQQIGMGKEGIQWPVLMRDTASNSAALRSIVKGDINEAYFEKLNAFRNKSAVKRKKYKLAPIERGWTGNKMGGQSIGPPHPDYPNFDSRILELKVVATMTATKGRFRRFSALVATGNGQGIVGIATARSTSMRGALRRAKGRAFLNLMTYNLKENRTLFHVGHENEWKTTIFALPKPEGYGLTCHRVISTLCKLIGIKDMYAKVEGNTKNYRVLVYCFLKLLRNQKTYEEIANSTGLHVVEFSADRDMYPRVLASPKGDLKIDEISSQVHATSAIEEEKFKEKTIYTHPDQRPVLLRSNPRPKTRLKFQRPEENPSFFDDLVDLVDHNEAEDIKALLAEGERDLDTLLVYKGRVPLIKPNRKPGYLNLPGVLKKQKERYRFRNQEAAKRERQMYSDFDTL